MDLERFSNRTKAAAFLEAAEQLRERFEAIPKVFRTWVVAEVLLGTADKLVEKARKLEKSAEG